jgi:DNA-binding transcriptional MerR regulator
MPERDASPVRPVRKDGAARRPMATGASAAIPDKLYFRIGEVAALAGVPAYVLRYWQTEFPQLQPKKSGSGQRLYRQREVELVLRIRDLLYRERFTIEGAKRELAREDRGGRPAEGLVTALARLRAGLEGLAASLGPTAGPGGPRATGRR